MTTRPATNAEIRRYLGHHQGTRYVRIKRTGRVEYYGALSHTDRSHDYWHECGHVSNYRVTDGLVHN
jgi:hypothetical protein